MFSREIIDLATEVIKRCESRGLTVSTTESCTGGLIGGALTEIAGSSAVFLSGFVTYANEAKRDLVGVAQTMLDEHGAVSEPVARAMAEGGLKKSDADICVACSGVAGPTGGTEDKPVGMVHMACAREGVDTIHLEKRYGDIGRSNVREQTVIDALELILRQADNEKK